MSYGMTHDEARDALDALALDALDASERDAVLTHVAGCPSCRADLVALRHTVAELSYAVDPVPMSPAQRSRIRARLLARATTDRGGTPSEGGETVRPPSVARSADVVPIRAPGAAAAAAAPSRRGVPPWAAIAAGVVALVSAASLVRVRTERDGLRATLAVMAAGQGDRARTVDSLLALVADRDRLINDLTRPDVAVMTLAAAAPQSPSGLMFWSREHDSWVFVAHHLPAPKSGRAYQLWLVTPTSKVSAGTFAPDRDGHALVRATYALPRNRLAAVAVTEEPAGGSPQPTSTPVLVAANSTN